MSENILQNIIQKKIEKVDKLKKSLDLRTLDELIDKNSSYINFKEKIENNLKKNKTSIIAEIKKASPSAGIIIDDYNPVDIAQIYLNNKATCLSVLTEEDYFLGNLIHISKIKDKINLQIPLKYGTKISGHICQGHVDTVGKVLSIKKIDKFSLVSSIILSVLLLVIKLP